MHNYSLGNYCCLVVTRGLLALTDCDCSQGGGATTTQDPWQSPYRPPHATITLVGMANIILVAVQLVVIPFGHL